MENGIEWFYTNTGEDFLIAFIEFHILYNVCDEYCIEEIGGVLF